MPPTEGETAPDFEALLCDGETFRSTTTLADALDDRGGVLVSTGFAFSAIAQNWWKQFVRAQLGRIRRRVGPRREPRRPLRAKRVSPLAGRAGLSVFFRRRKR